MRWRYLLPLAGVVLLIGLLAVGLKLDPRKVPSPLIGKPAPAFDLPTLAQPERRLATTDLRGEVAVVNVWASWCVTCREEHPVLMDFSRRNLVPLYGLNYKDERTDALAWLAEFGNPYRDSVSDSEGKTGLDWGVYGVPETFILDKQGRIRYKHIGAVSAADLQQRLLPLITDLQREPG